MSAGKPNPEVASKQKFIENWKIRVGVDLSSGGSLFWFSELPAVFVDYALTDLVYYKGAEP